VLRASAKVNLALEVLGKRADGYHEIATVLQAVDLFDRIAVETADSLSLHTDDPDLPTDEGNLVMRAARLLQKAAGIETGARIRLQKRIPVAAGLGGGSSDAAATLWGLSRLWKLRWPTARLQELAVELGMDVPFFLGCGAYRHHVPASVDHIIQRGEFLTSYTPYQPEIAQGTLQVLFEFQTQVARLYGCEVANASMYDGSTACWEAIGMARRITRKSKAITR